MRLVNAFEGAADETTISTANSGGASGDAWDAVSTVAGSTRVYDTAERMYGTRSMRIVMGATSGANHAAWSTALGGTYSRLYLRCFWRGDFSSLPNTRTTYRARAGGTTAGRVQITSGGLLRLIDSTSTSIATGSVALTETDWWRVEWSVGFGAAAVNPVRLYRGDSTVLLDEVSASGDFGVDPIDEVNFGQTTGVTNAPAAWWDMCEVRDDGWPGPVLRRLSALGAG